MFKKQRASMCLMTLPPELSKALETGSDAGQRGSAAGITSNDSHTLASDSVLTQL